jgi:hypothetical protein
MSLLESCVQQELWPAVNVKYAYFDKLLTGCNPANGVWG